ncbi:unnamed protein product [Dibothriocephalus latus]|uniref:Reverse transcriptase domain-containing protein n=1 Tax=Dibothriocephalus latus TaxID=60516 RepID=A0A3P6R9A7_DIBLA|nr:unnamed protein product [Dibothriocephalus latus]
MDTMLTNVPGTVAYLDEILVVGRTDEKLFQRFDKVMENLSDYGSKINMEKSKFLRKELHHLGCVANETGKAPDSDRILALQKIRTPQNVKELQSFMGFSVTKTLLLRDFIA